MSYITKFAEGFMHLFQTGAETFISWMTGIVPVVLMLMVAMNTLIAFLGEERVTKVAKLSAKNPVTRYLVLPFLSASQAQFCHTSNGVFPHINPGELFVWLGIAQGIDTLGLNSMDLAIRYMFVGILMNFIGGWVTDFTTAYVCKQQGITLSKTVEIAVD